MSRKLVAFAAKGMEPLLQRVVPTECVGRVHWDKFPDGTDNIFIEDIAACEGADVFFLASFSSGDEIMRQFSVLMVLLESFIEHLTICLPFYPTATMERVDKEGTVATANTLAWLFNSLPRVARPTKLVMFDLHTLQNRFYLKGGTIARLDTAIPLLVDELKGQKDVAIVFPDDGACKRFEKLFPPTMRVVVCGKVRSGDKRMVTIQNGDLAGCLYAVIVDDLVQTGGTLVECAKALKKRMDPKTAVCAYATHAVFPNSAWKRFTTEKDEAGDPLFECFWITDSVPTTVAEIKADPAAARLFQVLSLAPLIAKHL